ncbi:MAG: pilin [Candidatus Peregrinibacteria bacterium]
MKRKTLITIGLIALFAALTAHVAQAVYTIPPELRPSNEPFAVEGAIEEGGAASGAVLILQLIAGSLLYFAAPLAIIFIGLAAFDIVAGGADTEKIEQGKKHLTWSIVGLVLIILSYSGVRFVINFAIKAGEATPLPTDQGNTVEPYTGPWVNPEEVTPIPSELEPEFQDQSSQAA